MKYGDGFIIASGEVKPRVRTKNVWFITPVKSERSFGAVNFTVLVTKQGAIAGMLSGIGFTAGYISWFKLLGQGSAADWWFGISPEGIGSLGMLLNFAVTLTVTRFTDPPPPEVQAMVDEIRLPS